VSLFDRREAFTPPPRPEWMRTLNALGAGLDIAGVVPLSPESLMGQATLATGLADFGDDDWLEGFTVLMRAIDAEANLHFVGRILTRAEFLTYLEARLRVVAWYRGHPEVVNELIDAPVFITGYGRSGTTILFEVMSQDPRFRTAQKWEAARPVPPPRAETYRSDPRIGEAESLIGLIRALSPEHDSMHRSGADLPVESIELEYPTFASEVFPIIMQVPSYAAWLRKRDLTPTFEWQKTILKLLQSQYRAKHWLMKSPTHLGHLEAYRKVFPGMRVIFAHRDPVVTADSLVNFIGALFWQRTDNPWGSGNIDAQVMSMADARAKVWDGVIAMIEDGRIARGGFANFHYHRFVADPIAAVQSIYDQLGMVLTAQTADRMRAYLAAKTKGLHGAHLYEAAPANAVEAERVHYRAYQRYFAVPDEI
jgi:hypothetical protein